MVKGMGHSKRVELKMRRDRIKEIRLKRGITQNELAARIGVSGRTVHRYENGEADPPSHQLELMAKEFGVSIDYLVGTTDEVGDYYEETGLTQTERMLIQAFRAGRNDEVLMIVAKSMKPDDKASVSGN